MTTTKNVLYCTLGDISEMDWDPKCNYTMQFTFLLFFLLNSHKFLVAYQMHNYKTPIKPTQQSITLHNAQLLKVETTQKLKVCACLSLTNHNGSPPILSSNNSNTTIPTHCFLLLLRICTNTHQCCTPNPRSGPFIL